MYHPPPPTPDCLFLFLLLLSSVSTIPPEHLLQWSVAHPYHGEANYPKAEVSNSSKSHPRMPDPAPTAPALGPVLHAAPIPAGPGWLLHASHAPPSPGPHCIWCPFWLVKDVCHTWCLPCPGQDTHACVSGQSRCHMQGHSRQSGWMLCVVQILDLLE